MKKKKKKNLKKNIKKKNIKKPVKRKNKKKKNKRIKIKFGRVFIAVLLLASIIFLCKTFIRFPIKNIYIENNTILKDQEIIDIAHLNNYPSYFKYSKKEIEKRLKKNIYIKDAKVTKKNLSEINIKIDENRPLLYNQKTKKTVLEDNKEVDEWLSCPVLINYVPDKIYTILVESMNEIESDILSRISEIKYDPSNVDEERFLFSMLDGNYVYITLDKIKNINNYVEISLEIINKFGDKKGILYLDAGEYFEIKE